MQNLTLICSLQRLEDPGSYGFSIEVNGEQVDGFVVRRDNECFLDVEGALIQCAVHDARFLIESGECVMGPCPGESLEALSIRVQDNNVYLLARISHQDNGLGVA